MREALADTRVVLVNGARQAGKSTLVRHVGAELGADWRTFDRAATRRAATFDETEFVTSDRLIIIDEVQRVPELLLAIKERVDTHRRPGQFLLTGSARILGLRSLPDTLVGRMETIELWPLSQGEIDNTPDAFIDAAFALGPKLRNETAMTRSDYLDRIVRGGFPEAVVRAPSRRSRFLDGYVADLVNRDVIQLSDIQRGPQMRKLIGLLAAQTSQLLRPGTLAGKLGLSQQTVEHYLWLLEEVFLVKRIPAWSRNLSSRTTRTPKMIMVDSGIAAELTGQTTASLRRRPDAVGPLLESFVISEIARQLSWSSTTADLFHYRTRDQVEVDLVLENRRGEVVAIEVKASATVRGEDFAGLRHLQARLGDDLLVGIVLYTGDQTLPFGPGLRAMPIAAVWEAGAG